MAESSKSTPVRKRKLEEENVMDDISSGEKENIIDQFKKISLVTEDIAELLFKSGFTSLKSLSSADLNKLKSLDGFDVDKAEQIKNQATELLEEEEDEDGDEKDDTGDEALSNWLTGEGEDDDLGGLLSTEIEKAKEERDVIEDEEDGVSVEDNEALKAWLAGEDDSFSSWLGEETFEDEREELREEIKEKEESLDSRMGEVSALKEEFQKRLSELESGDFEVEEIVEENARLEERVNELQEKIEELKEEREQLNDEIEEIKQGSVAMLKYLKAQKKSHPGQQVSIEGGDEELKAKFQTLKEENEELREKLESSKSSIDYSQIDDEELEKALEDKDNVIEQKEEEIEEKNQRIQDLQDELKMKRDQLDDLREKLEYKEDELNQREEDLMHREQKINKQKKELEAKKKELGDMTEQERQRKLEDLKNEIERKEQELKAKTKYIEQKERELRAREEDLIDEELEEREEEILQEIEQEKAKTGTTRLDDLLLGGIPLGSNVSMYGPPHVGKGVLINSFIAEGLEKGVPAIWVITDKTVEGVREEMKFVLPTYEEYEVRDLVYYVDAYSISMGEVNEDLRDEDFVKYVDEQSDVKAITEAVEEFATQIKENHRYYRLAFVSVSTLIAYLDTSTTFQTLQPFSGRRKRDKAVSLYTLEKGMHSEQDISMLGHMMDGEIEFKYQQLQTHLKVEGLGDVQTRDWVKYTASKTGITMGSFSLDTIR
ncbi:MAG: ATPase domain-containing protein [Candidatus Saliniplasma sp.]